MSDDDEDAVEFELGEEAQRALASIMAESRRRRDAELRQKRGEDQRLQVYRNEMGLQLFLTRTAGQQDSLIDALEQDPGDSLTSLDALRADPCFSPSITYGPHQTRDNRQDLREARPRVLWENCRLVVMVEEEQLQNLFERIFEVLVRIQLRGTLNPESSKAESLIRHCEHPISNTFDSFFRQTGEVVNKIGAISIQAFLGLIPGPQLGIDRSLRDIG